MKLCFVILTCLLMAGTACNKSNPVLNIDNQLYYIETQCSSNPWNRMTGILVAESDTEKIKSWLYQNGITPLKIAITERRKDLIVCLACQCPTGRVIWVVFDPADLEKAKSLGFLKP